MWTMNTKLPLDIALGFTQSEIGKIPLLSPWKKTPSSQIHSDKKKKMAYRRSI
jgi:uncharacterized membrane protein (UPF0127 family)